MPAPKIRVRSTINGQVTEVSPQALRHFPDFERVDEPDASPAPAVESPKPSTSRSTAAKTTDKE
ncbi:hypothetical protein [Nonomuraea sp. NPDC049129]|uniref:hypothetical protein n=1 Tax=Nonomuraea sp. NPDC049129 TaxID=3155272 RepID=UPI0033F0B928